MPSINLIASQREQKRRLEQSTRGLFYVILAELGVVLLVISFMLVKLVTTQTHVAQLTNQMSSLQPKVNQIQLLQSNTDKLKPMLTTLNEARNNTLYWYTALQTVNASLPDHAWLTNIGTSGDPTPPKPVAAQASGSSSSSSAPLPPSNPPQVTFVGMAASSDQVGVAMMKMNQFSNISSVTLGGVDQDGTGPVKAMKFTMVVLLKPNTALDANLSNTVTPPIRTASIDFNDTSTNARRSRSRGEAFNYV